MTLEALLSLCQQAHLRSHRAHARCGSSRCRCSPARCAIWFTCSTSTTRALRPHRSAVAIVLSSPRRIESPRSGPAQLPCRGTCCPCDFPGFWPRSLEPRRQLSRSLLCPTNPPQLNDPYMLFRRAMHHIHMHVGAVISVAASASTVTSPPPPPQSPCSATPVDQQLPPLGGTVCDLQPSCIFSFSAVHAEHHRASHLSSFVLPLTLSSERLHHRSGATTVLTACGHCRY
jgi:hypothetical protein